MIYNIKQNNKSIHSMLFLALHFELLLFFLKKTSKIEKHSIKNKFKYIWDDAISPLNFYFIGLIGYSNIVEELKKVSFYNNFLEYISYKLI